MLGTRATLLPNRVYLFYSRREKRRKIPARRVSKQMASVSRMHQPPLRSHSQRCTLTVLQRHVVSAKGIRVGFVSIVVEPSVWDFAGRGVARAWPRDLVCLSPLIVLDFGARRSGLRACCLHASCTSAPGSVLRGWRGERYNIAHQN